MVIINANCHVAVVTMNGWTPKKPKPKAVPVLLHRRGTKPHAKLTPSDTPTPVTRTPSDDRRSCATPVSGRETPCERFTAANLIYKKITRKELPVKVAEIVTGQENANCNTSEELSRETFIKMNRAIQANRSYKRAKSEMRNTRQRAWRYVHEISAERAKSVPLPKGEKFPRFCFVVEHL